MQESLPVMQELFGWLQNTCTPERLVPGGFAATIHEAVERGDIPEEAVVPLMAAHARRPWLHRSERAAPASSARERWG